MALFSTLLSASASNEQPTPASSDIPTLIQLFTSKSITFDENAKLDHHAILSYQALEVTPPAAEGESTLFGNKRRALKGNQIVTPNLGVWNTCISKNDLVDSLLTIPSSGSHYCMTVDLSDPTMVEPSISMQHEALVRLLIQQTRSITLDPTKPATTTLSQLKTAQFGLAPEEKAASSQVPAEADEQVKISLIICALVGPSTKDDYKETQAQNLILYHLRRFAAALDCTLVFCGKTDMEVPTVPLDQLAHHWREWILGNSIENVFAPGNHQVDLIESVLLRNAQYKGEWDASTDSLWKALPPSSMDAPIDPDKAKRRIGDDTWLYELRESVASVQSSAPALKAAPTAAAAATKNAETKTDDAALSSFFNDLLAAKK